MDHLGVNCSKLAVVKENLASPPMDWRPLEGNYFHWRDTENHPGCLLPHRTIITMPEGY